MHRSDHEPPQRRTSLHVDIAARAQPRPRRLTPSSITARGTRARPETSRSILAACRSYRAAVRSGRSTACIARRVRSTPGPRAVSLIENLLRSLDMTEEAAKVQGAVKQKNRTLALPPARHRRFHDNVSRTATTPGAGGAIFCFTAPKPSQTPKVSSTTEGGSGRAATGGNSA